MEIKIVHKDVNGEDHINISIEGTAEEQAAIPLVTDLVKAGTEFLGACSSAIKKYTNK